MPLSRRAKAGVVKLAFSLRVPLELTWGCHGDGDVHCWKCAGCRMRIEAFREAGVKDPLRSV